jgi:Peptidase A4 family
MRLPRSLMLRSLLLAGAFALFGAPAAVANSSASTSTNWSGYVAHGVKFRRVVALWTQPTVTCTPGERTYSAAWVGLGGYNLNSKALEQIGTEADCSASGKEVSSAWFELVPAPSRNLKMIVHPGDVMAGRVTVVGDQVTLVLNDRTRHKTFTRTVTDSTLDVTSADWIVEAPSECGGNQCQPLTLADYGSETFARAKAETVSGKSGSISSKRWHTAVITLSPGQSGRRFAGNQGTSSGESAPSSLAKAGTSFKLTYSPITMPVAPQPQPVYAARAGAGASPTASLQPGGSRR